MNVNDLVRAALPEDKRDRNVAIVSDNWTGPNNHNDPGFLSDDFPRNPPKLYITAESDDFDPATLSQWQDEGFNVEYLPMGDGGGRYRQKLRALHRKGLGPCETFGIVAYGDAASLCLEHYHVLDNNAEMKLGCLIAYYPTRIPDPSTRFPSSIRVLVHLAVGEVGIVKQTQMVGIQGKKRVVKQNVDRGIGVGGTLQTGYPCYSYEAEAGFAEHDIDEFDGICADLAWSRSLATARRAFRVDLNLESAVEANSQGKFYTRNTQQIMSTYTGHKVPHVTHVPTLTGGLGADDLSDFYDQYFINSNPPSLDVTLLSRTIGVNRVVDEMYVTFKHTQEMPWILPGVPPTNKRVEVILVSIVALRAGKLCHEHVYWDQASVLVQVGLLDSKVVPQTAQDKGVLRLPVVGRRAARRMFGGVGDGGDEEADNELIYAWEDSQESEDPEDESEPNGVQEKKQAERLEPSKTNGEEDETTGGKSEQSSDLESKGSELKTRHATVEDTTSQDE